ncbi:unnamed protein product [Cylicocyclus nassatus]|uniref:BTB domain-containing protein n=1 Tax=Cylicocyclus nassatus TaxID=53992 RepID=A0AA36GYQ4_CYLNA|nr:unnamed protein product [Cylicocyclus nassatus]
MALHRSSSTTARKRGRQRMAGKSNQKNGGRVKINVGGVVFETTVSTLTRLKNTLLSTMVTERWRNQEEFFVDRNPKYFAKVLDYLRDGENVTLPNGSEAREALRKEAEFYNLHGLAKMCMSCPSAYKVDEGSVEDIKTGDVVRWRESVIENYWKYLVRYWYEREQARYREENSRCIACGSLAEHYVGPTATVTKVDVDKILTERGDWIALRQHMPYMRGQVTNARDDLSCCMVQWGTAMSTHVPKSALRLDNPQSMASDTSRKRTNYTPSSPAFSPSSPTYAPCSFGYIYTLEDLTDQ